MSAYPPTLAHIRPLQAIYSAKITNIFECHVISPKNFEFLEERRTVGKKSEDSTGLKFLG